MLTPLSIGIVAPSAKVPAVEFSLGVERLKEEGFQVFIHPQCRKSHLFFAGRDEERAKAFFDFAWDPRFSILWCARGGSGAIRILPLLDQWTRQRGAPPKKLLVGYSDATALLEFVQARWGWSALHAPMPGARSFWNLSLLERQTLFEWVRGKVTSMPWGKKKLKFVGPPPKKEIRGQLLGGNLTVWASLLGTPYAPRNGKGARKILFFEDVSESLYRLDRTLIQLKLSGGFDGVQAIVLGSFEGCYDFPPQVLAKPPVGVERNRIISNPRSEEMAPLRKKMNSERMIPQIFAEIAASSGVPVAYGLPVGHGPDRVSLPFGNYRLGMNGAFELLSWNWIQ